MDSTDSHSLDQTGLSPGHTAEASDASPSSAAVENARLRLLAENQRGLIWANLAVSCVFASAMSYISGRLDAVWLLSPMIPLSILRYWMAQRFLRAEQPADDEARRRHRFGFIGLTLASSLIWSTALIAATPFDDTRAVSLSVFVIAGMSAGSIAGLSVYRLAYLSYLLPLNLLFMIRLAVERDEILYILALCMLVYVVVLAMFGRNANMQTTAVLRLGLENLRLVEEISNERDRAENASRAKSEFLSSMSHELRTPLNSILGFSQLLADDPDDPPSETHLRYINQVLDNGDHLLALINQVLDLSRIESGKLKVEIVDISLVEMVEDCIAKSRPAAEKRDIRLIVEDSVKFAPACRADPMHLRQILLNLISNGIKYNIDNGAVRLSASRSADDRLRINVADTGTGIPQEMQPHIFEAFNRLGHESGSIEGSGIGLTISKQLTELMGGRIGFRSESGSETAFWIELPVAGRNVGAQPPTC
jgi:signal transduction histidine kinase